MSCFFPPISTMCSGGHDGTGNGHKGNPGEAQAPPWAGSDGVSVPLSQHSLTGMSRSCSLAMLRTILTIAAARPRVVLQRLWQV